MQVAPDLQAPIDREGHPVREWINTLLQAAVIAKDKQNPTMGEVEVSFTKATPNTDAVSNTEASRTATEAGIKEIEIDEAGAMGKGEAEYKSDTMPSPGSKDACMETIAETGDLNNASNALTVKRYRRRRCEVEGCTKFARFNNACSGHGGRRLCAATGCGRVTQYGHKCSVHGGVKLCNVEGCRRAVQSRGCCKTHGGGVRCQHPACAKGAISKGFCRSHGGGLRCAQQSCQKWAQRLGYCVRHSKAVADGDATPSQPDLGIKENATIPLLQLT